MPKYGPVTKDAHLHYWLKSTCDDFLYCECGAVISGLVVEACPDAHIHVRSNLGGSYPCIECEKHAVPYVSRGPDDPGPAATPDNAIAPEFFEAAREALANRDLEMLKKTLARNPARSGSAPTWSDYSTSAAIPEESIRDLEMEAKMKAMLHGMKAYQERVVAELVAEASVDPRFIEAKAQMDTADMRRAADMVSAAECLSVESPTDLTPAWFAKYNGERK